ncbi:MULTISPECIES: GLPGLI family protein [Epilithonimonas]|uniref:GLPGLI family protein n=1 Tax=Epilithonimonas hispanica TaxID=358687 RepID=A0A3D9CUA5_9FLAO|nr:MULTISPECIES: GLPGLI family protein [Epilithonimonas]REC69218.1 GLPGLI family protein [Epilithonimonas hispanica]
MKKLFLFSLFYSIIFTSAQTHRFFYELKYKSDSLQLEFDKRTMVLDINPNDVKYYDYTFLEKDSLNNATNSQNVNWTKQIPVTRKINSYENMNFVAVGFDFFKYPTNDNIDWILEKETKKIQQFTVQKATTNFGGRKWIAWFTKEIPVNEGPYKFRGLPGLILEIQDNKNQFYFNLIRSQNLTRTYDTSNILEIRYGYSPILTTEKKYIEKAQQYFNDPFYTDKQKLRDGSVKSFEFYGKKYTTAEELNSISKDAQLRILKNNNPIELNKAIRYKK